MGPKAYRKRIADVYFARKFKSAVPEDRAAANLLKLKEKTEKKPEFLAIITGTGFAHLREDGIIVVPIGCLGP